MLNTNYSSEEKRRFLEEIIPLATDASRETEIQQKQYDFFLKGTNGGKLYKYRTFDNHGYALSNLINGTLHCSRPDSFNDPFDSNVGITFQSIFKAKWENEISLIEAVFDKFIGIAFGQQKIEECTADEQRIIKALSTNETIRRFVAETASGFSTQEEAQDYLRQHMSVLTELLVTVLQDPALNGLLEITKNILPYITTNITPNDILHFNNDATPLQDLARMNGINADTDEIGLSVLLYDKFRPGNKSTSEKVEHLLDLLKRQITEKMNSLFLIGCLATDQKNRLMWSHYADSYKGFCIEYDFSGLKDTLIPFPILYSETRPLVPGNLWIDRNQESLAQATIDLILGLLTKDKMWEYENEWRVLIPASNPPDIKIPITAVYLGENISKENKEILLEIAKNHHIPVKQMIMDRGEYELHAKSV